MWSSHTFFFIHYTISFFSLLSVSNQKSNAYTQLCFWGAVVKGGELIMLKGYPTEMCLVANKKHNKGERKAASVFRSGTRGNRKKISILFIFSVHVFFYLTILILFCRSFPCRSYLPPFILKHPTKRKNGI